MQQDSQEKKSDGRHRGSSYRQDYGQIWTEKYQIGDGMRWGTAGVEGGALEGSGKSVSLECKAGTVEMDGLWVLASHQHHQFFPRPQAPV